MVQMVLGTQVREQVDIAKNVLNLERENWLESMDILYAIHRSFSWLLVIATAGLVWLQQRAGVHKRLQVTGWIVTGLILFQMLLGLGMDRLGMPGALQVLHLTSVAILICAEMIYILITRFSQSE
jgi:cytochrome c oxidase assembly protein subunit 15